uniref:CRAL/TRIO N-terminal domain-containing protein n=1 Tax=Anopheles coluzzii TaxID=1518534 RepID=A0A6E8VXQ7_ANOCL
MASLKFDDNNVPYLDLGDGYRIALEGDEYTDAKAKEKAARELRETPDVVEQSLQELRSLLQEEKTLYVPMDNDAFMIKFLRPCKYYAQSAFELIKRYYRFRSKHPDLCDELYPASVKHVYAEGLVHFLPLRDQHGSRILVLECGSKYTNEQLCQAASNEPLLLLCFQTKSFTYEYENLSVRCSR